MLASSGVSATPFRRATCTPNAQGAGVSIESLVSGLEWGVENTPQIGDVLIGESFRGLAAPDFHVQQNGQVPTSFTIRDVDNNNLAVTTVGNELVFETASNSGNEAAQLFDIACQTCGTNTTPGNSAGSSCTISPHSNDSLCVAVGATAQDALKVVNCDGSNEQLFNIVF
ncbi:hypothetical protein BT96DRAFT_922432 [Gymnopus androsaceus JB14]|uniref:Ricin B lectin domain-containing protein n=1 Tax=Gymnopus androsaceus JB14 TaxID=1447944 RepID=A0A6A4HCB5_9AGAR|nr:hypothetical protein BT96DRAFT_922432 [Gymnopus androsaceus JB14]